MHSSHPTNITTRQTNRSVVCAALCALSWWTNIEVNNNKIVFVCVCVGRRRNATAKKTFSYPICSLLIEGRRYRMFLPSACRIAEANAVDSHSQSSFNSLLKLMLESKNDQKINSYTWSLTTITCHFLVVFIVCLFFVLLFFPYSLWPRFLLRSECMCIVHIPLARRFYWAFVAACSAAATAKTTIHIFFFHSFWDRRESRARWIDRHCREEEYRKKKSLFLSYNFNEYISIDN